MRKKRNRFVIALKNHFQNIKYDQQVNKLGTEQFFNLTIYSISSRETPSLKQKLFQLESIQPNSVTVIVDKQLYLIKGQVGYLSKLQTAGLSFIKRGSPSLHKEEKVLQR